MADTILRVEDLRTHFTTRRSVIKAVDGLSFSLDAGTTLCLVGASGSGTPVSSLSIMRSLCSWCSRSEPVSRSRQSISVVLP